MNEFRTKYVSGVKLKMKKIGLIGTGAIANYLLTEINHNNHENLRIVSAYVRNKEKYQSLSDKFGIDLYTEIDSFLNSDIDIVVEAATVMATKRLLPKVVKKKDAVIISIGALVDEELLKNITQLAKAHHHTIHLPSGAIGGLDLLQNTLAAETVNKVTLTTRKPAHSLTDEQLENEKVIFEGKASDAIKLFPKNINVSIVLSLAGLGTDQTSVRLIADPMINKNIHQVDISGDFGEATFKIKNNPLPSNQKTSFLAAISILGTLERLDQTIKIG